MKLLSIDGGGIKGLYSVVVLDYIERKYNLKIIDHVDIIAGTSIGGIIALALAAGKRPKEIIDFLIETGPRIFPNNKYLSALRFVKSLFLSKYGNSNLKEACIDFFSEDTTLNDLFLKKHPDRKRPKKPCVCIPSVNLLTGRNKVFKTPHSKSIYLDKDYKLWQVALATSAAPYYLPVAKIRKDNEEQTFIDGGVWGNNPSLVALTEALTYFKEESNLLPKERIELLSIGNISQNLGMSAKLLQRGLLAWNTKLVLFPLNCQSESIENISKLLFEQFNWNYIRIEHSNRNIKGIELDSTQENSLNLIQQLATDDISKYLSPKSDGEKKIKQFLKVEV